MFSRSSWLHLRFPFSYFLLPVFLFALTVSPNFNEPQLFWTFFIVHFLLYPASNGYNSYFDKDENSIGALKNPPPVKKGLYYLSLTLDCLAIALGFLKLNLTFALMLLVYGLVSKAYSHPSIRLKKYAITSWIITGVFQGFFTFIMCYVGINNYSLENALRPVVTIPALLACIMLWANYPMTQVYQHDEDARHGDITLSMRLGIRGTFYFTASVFAVAVAGFLFYFKSHYGEKQLWDFVIALSPILAYFFYWMILVLKNERKADFSHTMWLNFISATALNVFFIYLFISTSQVHQLF